MKTPRDEDYLDYIRGLPCTVCKQPSEPHHTGGGGMGLKGADYRTIPLCGGLQGHHRQCHDIGKKTFYVKHNIDVQEEIIRNLERYLVESQKENT